MTTTPSLNSTVPTQHAVGSIIKADGTKTTETDKTKGGLDKDAFLSLLVAQLKYQTPDSAADTTQIMQQTAQFTMVESLENMAKQFSQLNQSTSSATALGIVGKTVVATPSSGTGEITGVVTSVKLGTDGPTLKIGDMEVPMSQVKEVKTA